DPQTLQYVNQKLFEREWEENASGNISKWEMDSLFFYHSKHELADIDFKKYGIVNFFDLPEEPIVESYYKFDDIKKPKYKIFCIVGTVLDKNKNKHTVTLLTPHGVVTVKYHDGAFAHYDKQISRIT